MTDLPESLAAAAALEDRAERTIHVAAVLSEALARAGVNAVLVGGGAIEIYTRSAYTTHDLDFVAPTSGRLRGALADLGFVREGRHWLHDRYRLAVEFPGTVLAPARSVSLEVDGMRLEVIAVEDLIVDRLAGWKHWGWDPDGAAAVLLLALHGADLDRDRLEERAEAEDVTDALGLLDPLSARRSPIRSVELRRLRERLDR